MNSRLKNKALWISIAAFIPMFLKGIGYDVLPSNYNEIVNTILGILVAAGILNSPTTENTWYGDDKTSSLNDITNDIKQ